MNGKHILRIKFWLVLTLLIGLLAALWIISYAHVAKAQAAYSYQIISTTAGSYGTALPDKPRDVELVIKNTGTATWCKACPTPMRLGTERPRDRGDGFYDQATWDAVNRIPMQELAVLPGQNATFKFKARPAEWVTGTHTSYFAPVVDGVTWLPDYGINWTWTRPAPTGTILFTWYGPNGHRWIPGLVVDTPEGGQYDSSDPNVQRRQLTQIRDAGFDFVILDFWLNEPYGQGAYTRANAIALANMIKAEFPTLKFTFLIENQGGGYVPSYVYTDFWNLYGNDAQWYRHPKTGTPTLFTYTTVPSPNPYFSQVEWHNMQPDPRLHTMYWFLEPARVKNRMLTIAGSYSDTHFRNPGLNYDGAWSGWLFNNQTAKAWQNRGTLDVLVVYGWNEYYERSQLEPNHRPDSGRHPSYMMELFTGFNTAWRS